MTTAQKFSDFARRHEYGIILTSWAAALTGSFTYIMRDPYVRASWEWDVQCIDVMYSCSYQSVPQKVCRTASNPEDHAILIIRRRSSRPVCGHKGSPLAS